MLVILRIVFGLGLLYAFYQVRENAQTNPETGDLTNALYLAVCVFMGILNAIVWAPYFGSKISEPLTGTLTTGAGFDPKNRWVRLILWCERRGYRRLALLVCFLEGVRHPLLPAAFVFGLRNAKPGTWWEKIYAREVFRFDNTQNSLQALAVLKRHGIDPGNHPRQEVNLVLRSLEKPVKPDPAKLDVPRVPQSMPLKRNPLIRLFDRETPVEPPIEASGNDGRKTEPKGPPTESAGAAPWH
jgi:hypothetical protein